MIFSVIVRPPWTSSGCYNRRCLGRKCCSGLDSSKRQRQCPDNRLHHSKSRQEDNGRRSILRSILNWNCDDVCLIFTSFDLLHRSGTRALSTTIATASPSQSWWLETSTFSGSFQRTCAAWANLPPKPKRVPSSLKKVRITVLFVPNNKVLMRGKCFQSQNSGTNLSFHMLNVSVKLLFHYFFHSCYLKGTVSDVFHPEVKPDFTASLSKLTRVGLWLTGL